MINQFLRDLSVEQRLFLYDSFSGVMGATFFVSLHLIMRKYKLKKALYIKIVVSYVIAFLSAINICPLLYKLTDGAIPAINLGVASLPFLFILLLLSCILKIPLKLCTDISVPVFILGRGFGVLGCLFVGCCHGAAVSWGLYSHQAGETVIPTAIADAILSWIIVAHLLGAAKKADYTATGTVAAKGLFLFGVLRFVVDILRDNRKLFWMITAEGICGILYVLAGAFLLYRIAQNKKQS